MGIFWNTWIIGLTLINLGLVVWVLFANRKVAVRDDQEPENRTTGHVYDGIEEYDNPLPKWWFQLFVGTLIFSAIYLMLYPGLGSFPGLLGWTQINELQRDQTRARDAHAEDFAAYLATPIPELAQIPAATKMGARLFADNCAVCHGAGGMGNYGYPDLTDGDWLYGGSPEQLLHSIRDGRRGFMPGFSAILNEQRVQAVTDYVLSLSGAAHRAEHVQEGKAVFTQNCAVCHGANGEGNTLLGAPNLANGIWLYEGTREAIAQGIRNGRANVMPAQKDLLQEEKIHLLAAYVYSLSKDR